MSTKFSSVELNRKKDNIIYLQFLIRGEIMFSCLKLLMFQQKLVVNNTKDSLLRLINYY